MKTNARFVAYCLAHGETDPATMIARDAERYPGGKMCGFIVWISQRWSAWRASKRYNLDHFLSTEDHAEFDAWLEERNAT